MSFCDWFIHKYIMHNNNTNKLLLNWRTAHLIHHKEINKEIECNDTAVSFCVKETINIALVTSIFVLVASYIYLYAFVNPIYHLISMSLLFCFHILGAFVGISIHNYCHTLHHKCKKDTTDCCKIAVPDWLYTTITNHHENHHKNVKRNFCVVFLGFDNLIGTKS